MGRNLVSGAKYLIKGEELIVTNLNYSDAGQYTCHAKNILRSSGTLVTCLLEVSAFFLDIIIDACKGQGLYHTQVENLLVTLFRVPLIQSFVLCARCICLFVYLFCLAVNFYKK